MNEYLQSICEYGMRYLPLSLPEKGVNGPYGRIWAHSCPGVSGAFRANALIGVKAPGAANNRVIFEVYLY
jgi:hypothetical protein